MLNPFYKLKQNLLDGGDRKQKTCDIITDPIGIQTSLGRKFRPTCNFEIMVFFSYIQLYGILSLFNKYWLRSDTKNQLIYLVCVDLFQLWKVLLFKKQHRMTLSFKTLIILCMLDCLFSVQFLVSFFSRSQPSSLGPVFDDFLARFSR